MRREDSIHSIRPSIVAHFLVPADSFFDGGKRLALPSAQAHHVARALRARPGEYLTVCVVVPPEGGGEGRGSSEWAGVRSSLSGLEYLVRLDEVNATRVLGTLMASRPAWTEPKARVVLCQGLPKGDKMDLIVQKAVELGVYRIVPLDSERAVPALAGKKIASRMLRWQRIAHEAAQQARRSVLPEVSRPLTLGELLNSVSFQREGEAAPLGLALWEGGEKPLAGALTQTGASGSAGEVFLFVGPEGSFTPAEIDALRAAGVRTVALGPRIMRTETAAIAGLAAVMFSLGELGSRQAPSWSFAVGE